MKKMKKILAMLLAFAMVLGMTMTTMAAETPAATATITVEGLTANDDTVLKLYQVVKLDVENSTWIVADWVAKLEESENVTYVNLNDTPITIDWESLDDKVPENALVDEYTLGDDETSHTFDKLAVGAYMIKATGTDTTYNVMGEGTYAYDDNNHLIVPVNKTISAKGSTYAVVKSLQNVDQTFVAKGDTVVFEIETVFPSFPDDEQNRVFTITDTPTGMKITAVTVFVNEVELVKDRDYTVSELAVANQAVTITFTSDYIGEENLHATEAVKVVLTAVITSDQAYSNKAETSKSSVPSEVEGDSGSLTIRKTDGTNALQGAKFEIKLNNEALTFAPTAIAGEYTLVAGETEISDTDVCLVESPESGVIVLKGLGAGTYEIIEAQAPAGYSIVEVPDVTITEDDVEEEGEDPENVTIEVVNTKLIALPSTGGIGTTIFTIAGCAIMIAAAFLFFVSRRKENE